MANSDAQVKAAIRDLGDDSFDVREAASAKLEKMRPVGIGAVNQLQQDAEIQHRQ